MIIFLSIKLNISFWVLKRTVSTHRDGSFEYQQHMFWLRNKKKNLVRTLIWRPGLLVWIVFPILAIFQLNIIYTQAVKTSRIAASDPGMCRFIITLYM